jgi:Eukaryotic aspartyl protease
LGTLSEKNIIPSTSWSYLAGASYRSYPISAFGSLTFGGYDSTRLRVDQNLTLAGGSDEFRPMLLGIESISSGSDIFLSEPIIAALDSTVAQIWLPISACQAFESAFGLVWNETSSFYFVNDSQHSVLVSSNPSITFTISTGIASSNDRLKITLPYAAFDMMVSPPLITGTEPLRYFPLKRAANATQYTLGRTFLQEVYMIADYSRGRITLYQAVYPNGDIPSDIVTICPPNSTTCIIPTSPPSPPKSTPKLSTGTIAGISVGGVLAITLLGLGLVYLRRRRPPPPLTPLLPTSTSEKADYGRPTEFKPELPATEVPPPRIAEMEDDPRAYYAEKVKQQQQHADLLDGPRQELESRSRRPCEMAADPALYELPAEVVPPVSHELPAKRE